MRSDKDYRNYEGSRECLFNQNSTSGNVTNYDDWVEMALDEAIKLFDDIDEERTQKCGTENCEVQDCGDDDRDAQTEPSMQNCGQETYYEINNWEQGAKDTNCGDEMTNCGDDQTEHNTWNCGDEQCVKNSGDASQMNNSQLCER